MKLPICGKQEYVYATQIRMTCILNEYSKSCLVQYVIDLELML